MGPIVANGAPERCYRVTMHSRLATMALAAVGLLACKPTSNGATDQSAAVTVPSDGAAKASPASAAPIPSAEPTSAHPSPPFLWRITTAAGPSYLFGTMHLGVGAEHIHPKVWEALDASRQVTLEIIASELSFAQSQELLFLPEGQSLERELSPAQWKLLKDSVSGFPESQLARVSPLMASVLISSQWLPAQTPLDQVIESRARAQHKELAGLEGFEETKSFTQSPGHAKYLAVMLDDLDHAKKELEDMHRAYLSGDSDTMMSLVFSQENQRKFPELYEQLFYRRNQAWVPKIVEQLEKGKAFVAVGAGHLLGDRSVVALLRAKGYKVERVETK